MEESISIFSFPQKIRPKINIFFSQKYFIIILLLLACCIYLPSLFLGYQSDDYLQLLYFNKQVSKKLDPEGINFFNSIFDLYAFSGFISGKAVDQGYMPWWSSRGSIASFLRPIASLLLAFDYSLWQDYPVIVHIHSLVWFLILIILVYYVYRNINKSLVLAGFSCFLFIMDDLNTWPVLFIAKRHIIVSLVFAFACFLTYTRYSREKKRLLLLLSYFFFTAGLLSSEIGIAICAYLFSFSLFLANNPIRKKMATLAPFAVIVIIWRFFYTLSGYGVYNQFLYIDPLNNPLKFLSALAIRYPLHFFSVVFLPVSEILLLSAPSIHIFLSIIALCVIVLLFFIFYPFFKKEKLKLFWLTGALLSVIPACMGMPSSRLLTFPCIGLSGLFSLLFKDFTQHWLGPQLKGQVFAKKLLSKFHDFSIRIVIPLLLILYLIISPLIIIMHYVDFKKGKEYRSGLANFGDKIVGEEKTIVVVKPPDTSAMVTGLFERAFTQKPVPEFVRFLCSGMQNLELYRIDKTSLLAKPEGGYTILPSTITDLATGKMKYFDDRYFSRWMETLYYNPQFPWKKGDIIRLTGLTISIKDVTEDGRILSALFEFEKPLESNTYEWIIWNSAASEYHPFPLPGIGGKIRI